MRLLSESLLPRSHMPMPTIRKNHNAEESHKSSRIENRIPPASGNVQPGKPFERDDENLRKKSTVKK